jgi:hypothetical protein
MTTALRNSEARGGKRRSRYQVVTPMPLIVTPVRARLLMYIGQYGVLTSTQLSRLIDLPLKTVNRQLRYLFDGQATRVVSVPRALLIPHGTKVDVSKSFGSAPNILQLSKKGRTWLAGQDLLDGVRDTPAYSVANWRFLAHHLMINDVRIYFENAAASNPQVTIERWVQERAATSDFRDGRGKVVHVRPDAHMHFRLNQTSVLSAFVEADRKTEGRERLIAKLTAYQAMLTSPHLAQYSGFRRARLLFVTSTAARRSYIAKLVVDKFTPISAMVWVADHEAVLTDLFDVPSWVQPGSSTLKPLLTLEQLSTRQENSQSRDI